MGDGVKIKTRQIDESMKRLLRLDTELNAAMDKALKKSSDEFVDLAKQLAPKDQGDLAGSITARKQTGGQATFKDNKYSKGNLVTQTRSVSATGSWGIYALWRWTFTEFGTGKARAQPFIFPAYRLLKPRHIRRMRRVLSQSVKRVTRK